MSGAEPVLLVAYELMANAVEHARTPFDVTVCFDGMLVVAEVRDESTRQPRLQPVNLGAARGLHMVAVMAQSWSCDRHAHGKPFAR